MTIKNKYELPKLIITSHINIDGQLEAEWKDETWQLPPSKFILSSYPGYIFLGFVSDDKQEKKAFLVITEDAKVLAQSLLAKVDESEAMEAKQ